jgi:hypothetical protein
MPPPVRIRLIVGLVAVFCSPLLELARVLVRFNQIVRFIVNANHSIM